MALASETTVENRQGEGAREGTNKISIHSNHPRKYNWVSSNVFKSTGTRERMRARPKGIFSFLSHFFFFIFRNMQGNFITYIAKYFRELRVRSDSVVTLTQIENPIRGINNDNSNAQRGEENRHKMSKLSRHISPQFLFFSFFCNYRNFDV